MSKKYDFTAYKVRTDADKASPVLEHDYRPVKDDEDIIVRCRHFRAGEKMTHAQVKRDGSATFDYRGIVRSQVISIKGLVLTVTDEKTGAEKDIEVKDAETLLSFPDEGIISTIVTGTALHLITGDSLTEEEQGN